MSFQHRYSGQIFNPCVKSAKLLFSCLCDLLTSFNRTAGAGRLDERHVRAFRSPNQFEVALNNHQSRLAKPDLRIQPQNCLYSLAYADDMPSFYWYINPELFN